MWNQVVLVRDPLPLCAHMIVGTVPTFGFTLRPRIGTFSTLACGRRMRTTWINLELNGKISCFELWAIRTVQKKDLTDHPLTLRACGIWFL